MHTVEWVEITVGEIVDTIYVAHNWDLQMEGRELWNSWSLFRLPRSTGDESMQLEIE